jgi:hypothetical protein
MKVSQFRKFSERTSPASKASDRLIYIGSFKNKLQSLPPYANTLSETFILCSFRDMNVRTMLLTASRKEFKGQVTLEARLQTLQKLTNRSH